MGFFRNNSKRLIEKFRAKSVDFANDLRKEIDEHLYELKNDYAEAGDVIPEYEAFVNELKNKLDNHDREKLEAFAERLAKVGRTARKGVEAMWELSRDQKKLSAETLREYDEAFE
jgi:hypothetical protein